MQLWSQFSHLSQAQNAVSTQINCQELVTAGFNKLCFDIGIPQNSVARKSDNENKPKISDEYYAIMLLIKSTNMGDLELEGF